MLYIEYRLHIEYREPLNQNLTIIAEIAIAL